MMRMNQTPLAEQRTGEPPIVSSVNEPLEGDGTRAEADERSTPDSDAVRAAVDDYLERYVSSLRMPANLEEAVRYALLSPGKRTRPILCALSCRAAGGTLEAALPAAAAVEMVHAFSLIHDDLPALDNDDLRRGAPTTHRAFGEALAILAGDGLLTLAFRVLAERAADPATTGRLTRELSQGASRMVDGQVFDTVGGGAGFALRSAEDRLRTVHRNKTAALIRAACLMGGISAGAEDGSETLAALSRYGDDVGLMFQIVDDLLDVLADAGELGKATQKDAKRGKLTYPAVRGVDGSREEIEILRNSARSAIHGLGARAEPLARLCDELAERTT